MKKVYCEDCSWRINNKCHHYSNITTVYPVISNGYSLEEKNGDHRCPHHKMKINDRNYMFRVVIVTLFNVLLFPVVIALISVILNLLSLSSSFVEVFFGYLGIIIIFGLLVGDVMILNKLIKTVK